jgi:HAE1 family hydrophobic/amphiphilic exporter-1
MSGPIALFVRRPVFTWVLVLVVIVLGLAGLRGLPLERLPDVAPPYVSVTTIAPGLSTEQVESDVSARIEDALATLGGLDRLDSTSQAGVSVVWASFVLSKDPSAAAQEARDRLARVADQLPAAARAPVVETLDLNATPIVQLALYAPSDTRDLAALSDLADTLVRPRLQTIDGVGDVRLVGAAPRAWTVTLDPLRLAAAGLVARDVIDRLVDARAELAGGERVDGATVQSFRIASSAGGRAALEALVVTAPGGTPYTLAQLGHIDDEPPPPSSLARWSGHRAISIGVLKRSGANTVEVARAVMARVPALQAALPSGVALEVVADDSALVQASIDAVEEHLFVGALLAALVVLVFLRDVRATVISALAIPASIIGTFAAVRALGMTLNMMTLLGLTLAVGIVIDDAIVVLENVVRVLRRGGRTPAEATVEATREIALAVLATTLSLVAVFLPVAFMDGIVGRFLAPFGLTMTVSILLSMAIAFSLTPMLCARWLRAEPAPSAGAEAGPGDPHAGHDAPRAPDAPEHDGPLERAYVRLLDLALRHRRWVGGALLATIAAVVPLLAIVPATFLPIEDEARFVVYVRLPAGTSAAETERSVERLAEAVRALPDVAGTMLDVGSPRGAGRGANEAVLRVNLTRRGPTAARMETVRAELAPARIPSDALVMVSSGDEISGAPGPDGAIVQLVLRGPDPDTLQSFGDAMLAAARAVPGTTDHALTTSAPRPELRLTLDEARAAAAGLDRRAVGDALATVDQGGLVVATLREPGRVGSTEVRVRLDAGVMPVADQLRLLTVRSPDGVIRALPTLAAVESVLAPGAVRRTDRARQLTLAVNTRPGTSDQAVAQALRAEAERLRPSADYTAETVGNAEELDKTTVAFGVAILLSFVFMYLVLAAQFESWIHPLTILVSLPLTVPFALLTLALTGESLNLFSALGLLVLFGVVKKNAILQVDHTLALIAAGRPRHQAILEANRDRLRPILMTTLAFVAGLVPMVVGDGAGAATNRAIAIGILGGQTLSLLFTLVATPIVFTAFDDARIWLEAWRARRAAHAYAPPLTAPGGGAA